jgi:tetratricopeptide (TPR) repeat protein
MIELLVVAGAWLVLRRHLEAFSPAAAAPLAPKRPNPRLIQLTAFADRLFTERKWLAAEKAYLSVLKLDHKNVTAYVHLGIIYSTQKNLPDAIECFTIASRLHPSAGSFQNLALAFYDNRNYIKSIAAYEKSVMFEPTAARYVGLGLAQLKLHNPAAAVTAFEQAVALEPTARILQRLASAYEESGRQTEAQATRRRAAELSASPK